MVTQGHIGFYFNQKPIGTVAALSMNGQSVHMLVANATIPLTSSRQASSSIPGWTEHVKPLRDKSTFWQNLWMDCGRPRAGVVAESMCGTRAVYHYAIRGVKKDEDNIIRERLAYCIVENKQLNFWIKIKRIRSKKSGMSRVIA